ncbi:MAG TPA: TetR/AcrR family transcriptional regulator [Nakamurella sp.]|jgi:AcrR family transcriptional regulator|nr:TetR/AcrR family transcriptional regulator [Nakamurella sp.]
MIIAAARDVIAERGLHATTVRDVAGAAQVAVGTVTYHFSGIAEVLAGVLEAEMAEYSAPVMAAARAAPSGAEGLRTLTEGLLATGDRAVQHWKLWLDFWALAAHYPHYSQWQSRVYRDLHALVTELLRRGRSDGSLTVTDAQQQSVEYVAMMDGLVVQGYLPGARLDPDRARDLLHAYAASTFAAGSSASGVD